MTYTPENFLQSEAYWRGKDSERIASLSLGPKASRIGEMFNARARKVWEQDIKIAFESLEGERAFLPPLPDDGPVLLIATGEQYHFIPGPYNVEIDCDPATKKFSFKVRSTLMDVENTFEIDGNDIIEFIEHYRRMFLNQDFRDAILASKNNPSAIERMDEVRKGQHEIGRSKLMKPLRDARITITDPITRDALFNLMQLIAPMSKRFQKEMEDYYSPANS